MKPNSIYSGDCVDVLSKFPDGSVDLIYVDPPFFSGKNYEVIWGDESEIRAFVDRWKGGIQNYIAWMEPKVRECHRVLKPTGSMYLHCDWHANAHLRILMDRIFGSKNFISEIVWRRKYQSATITSNTRSFGNNHDVVLFYGKTGAYFFDIPAVELKVNPKDYSKDEGGYYKTSPIGNYSKKSVQRMLEEGVAYKTRTGKVRKKTYLQMKDGRLIDVRPADNLWLDLPNMMHVPKKERMGYPTQKPEALLKRIIKASSNPGDLVLDPMCGCGTAIAVAQKLKRQWVGIDISPTACRLMVTRMQKLGVQIQDDDIIGHPSTLKDLKSLTWIEFQNWACKAMGAIPNPKKGSEGGKDGWFRDGTPIQVKQGEGGIGRPDVDNFETTIRREKKDRGVMVGFKFSKPAQEERARAKNEDGQEIRFVRVKELLEGKFDPKAYGPITKYFQQDSEVEAVRDG